MSTMTDKLIFDCIKQHYRPYDTHAEFGRGFSACLAGDFRNPHEAESISAKAWDRGVEAARLRIRRRLPPEMVQSSREAAPH